MGELFIVFEQLVENVIRDIKPQVVMVELDAQRVGSFIEESRKVRTDIVPNSSYTILDPFRCTCVTCNLVQSHYPVDALRRAPKSPSFLAFFIWNRCTM